MVGRDCCVCILPVLLMTILLDMYVIFYNSINLS